VLQRSRANSRAVAVVSGRLRLVDDELLTVKEIAVVLKLCTATVYKILDQGELPHLRVLNSVRVTRADLAAYMRAASRGQKR
jgi:excisionase family DNA binding protein